MSGLGAFVLVFLALLLPGQSVHGATLTLFTLLFGLSVPPLCFATGFLVALVRRHQNGKLGIWLNSAGIILYLLWITGGISKILG